MTTKFTPLLMLLLCILLTGCTKSDNTDKLATYRELMSIHAGRIGELRIQLSEIDIHSESSTIECLDILNEMDEVFQDIASLDIPKEFIAVESLAVESSQYMTESVVAYEALFSTIPYDEYSAQLAEESYNRAMKRQYYIGEILQGKVPSGDDITTVVEDDSESNSVSE